MRRTRILTLCVLACALAVCALSLTALNATVDEAERLRGLAVRAAQEEKSGEARSLVAALAAHWEGAAALMEVLASHDALNEVGAAIADAQICLERGDDDEFLRAMSAVRLRLKRLKDEQALRLANLY